MTDTAPPARFFAVTVLSSHLFVRGIPGWGPWDPLRLEYNTEPEITPGLVPAAGDRIVWTSEELKAAVTAHPKPTAKTLWVHESLEDETKRLWETRTRGSQLKANRDQ